MPPQEEFLFGDGAQPELHLPDPDSAFLAEISAAWGLPVGAHVHAILRHHQFTDLKGRLVLAQSPDLPLNPREPLHLRIGTIGFTTRQLASWSRL